MADEQSSPPGTVWSGRFETSPARGLLEYSSSVGVDRRLWKYDIACSRAHIAAQVASSVLSEDDADALLRGLDAIEAEFESGTFEFSAWDEDIHMAVERRLEEISGGVAGRLHAGRSRNDQVVTDFRLWVKDACKQAASALLGLVDSLRNQALSLGDALMYEYTHLQRAQPVPVAHHLLAHAWPLIRDCSRLERAFECADRSPLGAAAGVGSSLIVDTGVAADALGFGSVFQNSVDAVSDRDFAADLAYACAMAQVHMSRLAEELVIWSSEEFGFVEFSDAWATGSSIMPQKKNPDVAELVRGRAARVISSLTHLLVLLKGLPLAYNRDLQEDKEATFAAVDTVVASGDALAGVVSTARFRTDRMAGGMEGSFALATDLAEALVRRGVPFRTAHRRVATLVRSLAASGRTLRDATATDVADVGITSLTPEEIASISPRSSVEGRTGKGMGGPASLETQLRSLDERVKQIARWARS